MTTAPLHQGSRYGAGADPPPSANAATACPYAAHSASPVWARVTGVDQLEGDGPFAVSAGGADVVLVRSPKGLKGFEARCPHQGALLGEGEVENGDLVCRNHRWRFDVETGERRGGPGCLRARSLEVRGDDVFVALDPSTASTPFARVTRTKVLRTPSDLPGPRALPLVGNVLSLRPDRLPATLEGWEERYGRAYRLRLVGREIVVVSDPAMIQEALLQRPDLYRRAREVEPAFREVGIPGIFSVEGDAWRVQRRLVMGALSNKTIRSFYPVLKATAGRLRARWQRAAVAGTPVDILGDCRKFTVDATTQLAFGHDARTLDGDEDDIQRKLQAVFAPLNRRVVALFPYWRFVKLPSDRRFEKTIREVKEWLEVLVEGARARHTEGLADAASSTNFLDAMVASRDEAGQPFTSSAIFGNLVQILLAGEDTTANSIGFAIHELCESPASVAELRDEIRRVCGDEVVPPSLDAASSMAFAGAVASEAMRLRPVVPVSPLEANHDTVLGDIALPKGTRVWMLSRPGGLDPAAYEGAREFRPRRWLEKSRDASSPSQHFPFGAGPRACPGRSLALLLMRVALSTLYGSFDVERVGRREDVTEGFAFLMFPSGLRVRLHGRK
jgi:cytochrome P450/nitrite reductase/ring-hydroxylating ferredoxin subunit